MAKNNFDKEDDFTTQNESTIFDFVANSNINKLHSNTFVLWFRKNFSSSYCVKTSEQWLEIYNDFLKSSSN